VKERGDNRGREQGFGGSKGKSKANEQKIERRGKREQGRVNTWRRSLKKCT